MLNIFSIVLCGQPWIERHYAQFYKLPFDWRWTIVHGIADPVADTAWCQVVDQVRDDGTREYIDGLATCDGRITVIKQPRWPGKTAMCNAALATFTEPGFLFQVDADECWTTDQIRLFPALFSMYPTADCAQFMARVWVGPTRFVCTPGEWANRHYEWLRLWRWEPGKKFETHEPPALEGQKVVVGKDHTARLGLVFDHYSYVLPEQITAKEKYYGEKWSVEAWKQLQGMHGPVKLRDVLPFVDSDVMSFET